MYAVKWIKCLNYILTLDRQLLLAQYPIYTEKLKKRGIKLTKKQVEQWLRGIDTFGITQTAQYKFKRLRTYSYCLFDLMQADLLETTGFYPKQNKNVRYVIVAIEVSMERKGTPEERTELSG